jgi:hypothetical protein
LEFGVFCSVTFRFNHGTEAAQIHIICHDAPQNENGRKVRELCFHVVVGSTIARQLDFD